MNVNLVPVKSAETIVDTTAFYLFIFLSFEDVVSWIGFSSVVLDFLQLLLDSSTIRHTS